MEETEYEKVARQQREALEALGKAISETPEAKFIMAYVESTNRFLTKHAPDRLSAEAYLWMSWTVVALLIILWVVCGGR